MPGTVAKSRVARKPVLLGTGVTVSLNNDELSISGKKGKLSCQVPSLVDVANSDKELTFKPKDDSKEANMLAGTLRANVQAMVIGVTDGFEKKLVLKGTGYKTQVKGNVLNLNVGFSHPVDFDIPAGITMETPTATEIVIKGIDKQKVGQIAANIRKVREPECYKGKGIHYLGEVVLMKETKKK